MSVTRRAFLAASAGLAALSVSAPAIVRAQSGKTLNLYSSRHYDTDEALYRDFTQATGITINRIEAEGDPLIERLRAEGANSPADVFLSVDAGRIERARQMGLLQPVVSSVLSSAIPAHLRDPDNHWFGFSKRARVLMYHKDRVTSDMLSTYEALADPTWRGKILCRSSGNVYNQSLTGSLLAALGEEATLAWCKGLVANLARPPKGGDTDQIRAVAAGEGDVALANTYYLANIIAKNKPEDASVIQNIRVFFPNQKDRGVHTNISGGGIVKTAKNVDAARLFLEYLVSPKAQAYFANGNNEYPVIEGVTPSPALAGFGPFREDTLNAAVFAKNNPKALELMDKAGWA